MLPSRWSQPPCMNIDVSGVYHERVSPMRHTLSGPTGKRVPASAVCNNSPGIKPRRHTELDSAGSVPSALQQQPRRAHWRRSSRT